MNEAGFEKIRDAFATGVVVVGRNELDTLSFAKVGIGGGISTMDFIQYYEVGELET